MIVNPALIERIKRQGIAWLKPVIFKVSPIANIWSMLGL